MKLFIAILGLLVMSGFVLNRSYASIYRRIGEKHLINPSVSGIESIDAATSTVKRLKYVALGDSLTAGVGANRSKESFPYILSQRIAQSGRSVSLLNLGIPGARTQGVIDAQLQTAIAEDPDLITVLIGINDIHGFISAGQFRENTERIIDGLKEKTRAKIVFMTIPYLGTDGLMTWPYNWFYHIKTVEFNQVLKDVTQRKDLTLIDLYAATKDRSTYFSDYYSIDEFHPSTAGYKAWSDVIYADSDFRYGLSD
jgi:acyl-CoA thioesterase-1